MSHSVQKDKVDPIRGHRTRASRKTLIPPGAQRTTAWRAMEQAAVALLDHNDAQAAKDALMGALSATKWVRTGKDTWEEVPDHQVRGTISVKALEWLIGKPVERIEVKDTTPAGQRSAPMSLSDLRQLVAAQPGLLSEIVDSVVRSAKPAEVAPDQPVTPDPGQKRLMRNQEVTPG